MCLFPKHCKICKGVEENLGSLAFLFWSAFDDQPKCAERTIRTIAANFQEGLLDFEGSPATES